MCVLITAETGLKIKCVNTELSWSHLRAIKISHDVPTQLGLRCDWDCWRTWGACTGWLMTRESPPNPEVLSRHFANSPRRGVAAPPSRCATLWSLTETYNQRRGTIEPRISVAKQKLSPRNWTYRSWEPALAQSEERTMNCLAITFLLSDILLLNLYLWQNY